MAIRICILLASAFLAFDTAAAEEPLRVCATVPDLADLVRSVGGEAVEVTSFVRGPEDPHFLEARPSFIKALSRADLFVYVGLDLEIGWVPALLEQCRNAAVLPGAAGNFDASRAIAVLDLPRGAVDRSRGDVHPNGNPHYLLDPVRGWQVAHALLEKLKALRPARAAAFDKNYSEFARRLAVSLAGDEVVARVGIDKLSRAVAQNELTELLDERAGGWLGALRGARGAAAVADHDVWPYFAERFGLEIIGFLEPKPGIAPTTRHLQALVERMRAKQARVVLTVPYFDPKHAEFAAAESGANVVKLAHQCGALPGTERYLEMIDANVRALAAALEGKP